MYSSRKANQDIVFAVYKDKRTVFRLNDIALLVGESSFQSINKKLNYYVHTGKLKNPRRGIYTKPEYNPEELACNIYTPSYISLEYVLQKYGILNRNGRIYPEAILKAQDKLYQEVPSTSGGGLCDPVT